MGFGRFLATEYRPFLCLYLFKTSLPIIDETFVAIEHRVHETCIVFIFYKSVRLFVAYGFCLRSLSHKRATTSFVRRLLSYNADMVFCGSVKKDGRWLVFAMLMGVISGGCFLDAGGFQPDMVASKICQPYGLLYVFGYAVDVLYGDYCVQG